jgi:hypothetical protein
MKDIQEITSAQAQAIFNSGKEGHMEPRGWFIIPEADGTFTAIDNSGGCAWTEPFNTRDLAECWLALGDVEAEDIRDGTVPLIFIQNGTKREYLGVEELTVLHHFMRKFVGLMIDIGEMHNFTPLVTAADTLCGLMKEG